MATVVTWAMKVNELDALLEKERPHIFINADWKELNKAKKNRVHELVAD